MDADPSSSLPPTAPPQTTHSLSKTFTSDSRSGSTISGSAEGDIRDLSCCWNACHVRTGTVIIALFEVLLLFHALIFLVINLALGVEKYASYIPDFAVVIKYEYFIPMIVLQSLWIFGDMLAVFAVKLIAPSLMTLHFCLRAPPLLASVVIGTLFVVNAVQLRWSQEEAVNWALALTLSIFVTAVILSLYFSYATWLCFRYLKSVKKIMAAQKFWVETGVVTLSEDNARATYDNRFSAPLHQSSQGIENKSFQNTETIHNWESRE